MPGECCSPDELCNIHLRRAFEGAKGLAYGRGDAWAERVAGRVGRAALREEWPDTPKMRTIARRLVADLTQDKRLIEKFAACCAEQAAQRWRFMGRRWR